MNRHSNRGGQQNYVNMAARLFNTPLCVMESKAEIYAAFLQMRMGSGDVEFNARTIEAAQLALAGDASRSYEDWKPHPMTDGVAVIEIRDTLVHRGGLDPMSGMTSYQGIARKLRSAREDGSVKAIWLDVDSPGGEVAGLSELATEIALGSASEGGKPVWAYVNETACSAAYWLIAGADRVMAPMHAQVGSIGSVILHMDASVALDKAGIKPTIIRAGDRKYRGSPYEELDKATLERLQASVETVRRDFAAFVGMGRTISGAGAMATEAEVFSGQEALELGLIDEIASETVAWNELQRTIARG